MESFNTCIRGDKIVEKDKKLCWSAAQIKQKSFGKSITFKTQPFFILEYNYKWTDFLKCKSCIRSTFSYCLTKYVKIINPSLRHNTCYKDVIK